MRRRVAVVAIAATALLLVGCGDDGGGDSGGGDGGQSGDPELVTLLQEEAHQPEAVATCVADRLAGNDAVDPDDFEAIIHGTGTTDAATADAYGTATLACSLIDADPGGTTTTAAN